MRAPWRRPSPCRRTRTQVQRYLDGEADAAVAWQTARHVSQCEDCFADAETFRVIKDALARVRVAPDPAALARLRSAGTECLPELLDRR